MELHLNTSHVNVNHIRQNIGLQLQKNLNTSHVNVNPKHVEFIHGANKFKYISC